MVVEFVANVKTISFKSEYNTLENFERKDDLLTILHKRLVPWVETQQMSKYLCMMIRQKLWRNAKHHMRRNMYLFQKRQMHISSDGWRECCDLVGVLLLIPGPCHQRQEEGAGGGGQVNLPPDHDDNDVDYLSGPHKPSQHLTCRLSEVGQGKGDGLPSQCCSPSHLLWRQVIIVAFVI